ncbi:MAG TPA: aldose 1-epimerase, partial [Isosphaeraceae bacterium]|nr:aldose 1-epimerase [Isosphaeraceae bacterium]
MTYATRVESVNSRQVVSLVEETTGARASVLPDVGFNLFDLRLPAAGSVWPVVACRPEWPEDVSHPTKNGIPILFPFPNRIAGASFEFGGKTYTLEPNKPPNAIHGFATQTAWDVVGMGADDQSAWVTGRFQISRNAPEDLPRWPSDAAIEVRYTLSGASLRLEATISNPGEGPLPWGFGIHPYFHLPLNPDGDPKDTRIALPAREFWVLNQTIPTGERRTVETEPRLDFRSGRPIAGADLDDVLTGLEFVGDRAEARMVDESIGVELRVGFDRSFRDLVVFTPPTGEGRVLAVEPYTMTTDAVHLE